MLSLLTRTQRNSGQKRSLFHHLYLTPDSRADTENAFPRETHSIQMKKWGDKNRQQKRYALAPLSKVWSQDEDQNLRGHCTSEFPLILYQVQRRNQTRRDKIKDRSQRRARRLKRRACYSVSGEAGSFLILQQSGSDLLRSPAPPQ